MHLGESADNYSVNKHTNMHDKSKYSLKWDKKLFSMLKKWNNTFILLSLTVNTTSSAQVL